MLIVVKCKEFFSTFLHIQRLSTTRYLVKKGGQESDIKAKYEISPGHLMTKLSLDVHTYIGINV